jgi:hypothetical protein
MNSELIPSPRQTVDRAKHPDLGEGVVVYDNGPAWFRSDGGEVVPLASVGFGGASKDRHYLRAALPDGKRIELDTTGRQAGDRHVRVMTYGKRRGWLVQVARPIDEPYTPFIRERWEPDGGQVIKMHVVVLERGTPGANARYERRKPKRYLPEEEHWITYTLSDKTTFVFCYEKDAEVVQWPAKAHAPKEQSSLF